MRPPQLLAVAWVCVGLLWACTKVQGVQVATITVDTLVCVLDHETEPPTQIAIECGLADVQQVIAIIDAHRAAEVREAADK